LREPEEDTFRNALHDLLLYSPDRPTLAQRALGWATRLVGGASAVIIDADGSILAARDMTLDQAEAIAADIRAGSADGNARLSGAPATRLITPLHLQQGEGCMVVVAGTFTPIFGDDEISRLRQYANSITAGLDRVSLNARIASLEKAKTEFLNVASHELRGPMTGHQGISHDARGGLPWRAIRAIVVGRAPADCEIRRGHLDGRAHGRSRPPRRRPDGLEEAAC